MAPAGRRVVGHMPRSLYTLSCRPPPRGGALAPGVSDRVSAADQVAGRARALSANPRSRAAAGPFEKLAEQMCGGASGSQKVSEPLDGLERHAEAEEDVRRLQSFLGPRETS